MLDDMILHILVYKINLLFWSSIIPVEIKNDEKNARSCVIYVVINVVIYYTVVIYFLVRHLSVISLTIYVTKLANYFQFTCTFSSMRNLQVVM